MKKFISLLMAVFCVAAFSMSVMAAEMRRGSECPLCGDMGYHATPRYEYKDTGSEKTCKFCGYTTTVKEVIIYDDGYCTACNKTIKDNIGRRYQEARCPAHGDIM